MKDFSILSSLSDEGSRIKEQDGGDGGECYVSFQMEDRRAACSRGRRRPDETCEIDLSSFSFQSGSRQEWQA